MRERTINFPTWSNPAFAADLERKRLAKLKADALAVLEADDPPDVARFARRDVYAEAMQHFLRAAQFRTKNFVIDALLADPPLVVYRTACACGAIVSTDSRKEVFRIEALRALKNDKAHKALAVLGHVDWRTASRDVRAAYLIGRIFAERPK
jgi:hypothetical protein